MYIIRWKYKNSDTVKTLKYGKSGNEGKPQAARWNNRLDCEKFVSELNRDYPDIQHWSE